jgi:hypothetical protein
VGTTPHGAAAGGWHARQQGRSEIFSRERRLGRKLVVGNEFGSNVRHEKTRLDKNFRSEHIKGPSHFYDKREMAILQAVSFLLLGN